MTFQGIATIYCEGSFNNLNGSIAHALCRFSKRFVIDSIIDSENAGEDAGWLLDGKESDIPIYGDIREVLTMNNNTDKEISYLIIGVHIENGPIPEIILQTITTAIKNGLNIVSTCYDKLSENPQLLKLAKRHDVNISDVSTLKLKNKIHRYDGSIENIDSFKIAVCGNDSLVGKKTTAWILTEELEQQNYITEMIGTSSTSWLQGSDNGIVSDFMESNFVASELEFAIASIWKEVSPDIMVVECQGALMNPGFSSGLELLNALQPDLIVFQYAISRKEFIDFPGCPTQSLFKHIKVINALVDSPIAAIAINPEDIRIKDIAFVCKTLQSATGILTFDPLTDGISTFVKSIEKFLRLRLSDRTLLSEDQ